MWLALVLLQRSCSKGTSLRKHPFPSGEERGETDAFAGFLEFSGAFFLAEIFEKVSFDPYNFRINRLSARKSEQMKIFRG